LITMSARTWVWGIACWVAALVATQAGAGVVYLDAMSATPAVVDEGDTVVLRTQLHIAPTMSNEHFVGGSVVVSSGDGQSSAVPVPLGSVGLSVESAFVYVDDGTFGAAASVTATTQGTTSQPVYGWIPYTYYTSEWVCDFFLIWCWFGHYEQRAHTGYTWGIVGTSTTSGTQTSSAEAAIGVTVRNVAPTITSLTGDLVVGVGEMLVYAARGRDAGVRDPLTYAWDLDGDSAYDDAFGEQGSTSFGRPGIYTIGLRLSDDDGAAATDSFRVTVQQGGPTPGVPEPTTLLLLAIGAAALGRGRVGSGTGRGA